jgi:hypothetical protein
MVAENWLHSFTSKQTNKRTNKQTNLSPNPTLRPSQNARARPSLKNGIKAIRVDETTAFNFPKRSAGGLRSAKQIFSADTYRLSTTHIR